MVGAVLPLPRKVVVETRGLGDGWVGPREGHLMRDSLGVCMRGVHWGVCVKGVPWGVCVKGVLCGVFMRGVLRGQIELEERFLALGSRSFTENGRL